LPAAILFLFGYFTRSVVQERTIPAGDVLQSAAILVVAWWIQKAIRNRTELDRVPLDAVAATTARVSDLVAQILDLGATVQATDGHLLYKLRLLANEITTMQTLGVSVGVSTDVVDRLHGPYLAFKNAMTIGPAADLTAAATSAALLRTRCMEARRDLCRAVLQD
jgi:hypothetical protein